MDPETAELLQGLEEPPPGHEYVIVESETGEKIVLLVEQGTDLNSLTVEGIDLSGAEIVDESVQVPATHEPAAKPAKRRRAPEPDDDADYSPEPASGRAKSSGPRILQRGQSKSVRPAADATGDVDGAYVLPKTGHGGAVDGDEEVPVASNVRRAKYGPRGVLAHMGAADQDTVDFDDDLEPLVSRSRRRQRSFRNRTHGRCVCPECGEGFINTARLERHLAVHQVFGSYLCPLCGKTYKYEYNLFYHWRNTCSELDDIKPRTERSKYRPNEIKEYVDEIVAERIAENGTALGLNKKVPPPPPSRRGVACADCGLVVMAAHKPHHTAVHRGTAHIDGISHNGGYFCELCGLMFRARDNLMKHWRCGCPEIQVAMDPGEEMTMDDESLKEMVLELLERKTSENQLVMQPEKLVPAAKRTGGDGDSAKRADECDEALGDGGDGATSPAAAEKAARAQAPVESKGGAAAGAAGESSPVAHGAVCDAHVDIDIDSPPPPDADAVSSMMADESQIFRRASGAVGSVSYAADEFATPVVGSHDVPRTKWSMNAGPVQCPTCFRTFANSGRLERHIAGFHNTAGNMHACILCGNRFKYDYNLLYHYRHSCQYTKAFIDKEIREQMDAHTLRRLVRGLAQKEVRLTSDSAMASAQPPLLTSKRSGGDAAASSLSLGAMSAVGAGGKSKRAHGEPCPVCAVAFYGEGTLQKHIRLAHSDLWTEMNEDDGAPVETRPVRGKMPDAASNEQRRSGTSAKNGSVATNQDEGETKRTPQPKRTVRRASCDQCGELFNSNVALMQHIEEEHDLSGDDDDEHSERSASANAEASQHLEQRHKKLVDCAIEQEEEDDEEEEGDEQGEDAVQTPTSQSTSRKRPAGAQKAHIAAANVARVEKHEADTSASAAPPSAPRPSRRMAAKKHKYLSVRP